MLWIGLDIGGANIKVCLTGVDVFSVEFPLWKYPQQLESQLQSIFQKVPDDAGLGVTMTGELADCFLTRSAGVAFIVAAVLRQADGRKTFFYTTDGQWVDSSEASHSWLDVAAANWHAITKYCLRFLSRGDGFLIDIGSTTTDIIPIRAGQPAARGKTDYSRLASGELCYAGVHRTPVCSVLDNLQLEGSQVNVAREFFASMQDVFILLGEENDAPESCQTADGRPATIEFAAQRLSRMICTDSELLSREFLLDVARQSANALREVISKSLTQVVAANSDLPLEFVISGQGEWFAKKILHDVFENPNLTVVELSQMQGVEISRSAGAYSVSRLASENAQELSAMNLVCDPPNTRNPVRVIKIGGSLLTWDKTRRQIEKWLANQPEMTNVWIAGGGEMADYVRQWHLQTPLGQAEAHWICIDVMSITTRLVKSWFPLWRLSNEYETLLAAGSSENILFDSSNWLKKNSGLCESWQATSDSCAGFLAQQLRAEELVLLKSCDTTESDELACLSKEGIVDELFSQFASLVPKVRLVNIRSPMLTETMFEGNKRLSTGGASPH